MCSFQGVLFVYFDCIVVLAYDTMNFLFCVPLIDDGVADFDSEREIFVRFLVFLSIESFRS